MFGLGRIGAKRSMEFVRKWNAHFLWVVKRKSKAGRHPNQRRDSNFFGLACKLCFDFWNRAAAGHHSLCNLTLAGRGINTCCIMFAPSDRSTNENFVHSLRPNAGSGPCMSFSPVHGQKNATNASTTSNYSKTCFEPEQISVAHTVRLANPRVLQER